LLQPVVFIRTAGQSTIMDVPFDMESA